MSTSRVIFDVSFLELLRIIERDIYIDLFSDEEDPLYVCESVVISEKKTIC